MVSICDMGCRVEWIGLATAMWWLKSNRVSLWNYFCKAEVDALLTKAIDCYVMLAHHPTRAPLP